MPVFARSPTATAFATAWVDTVLTPALSAATGADQKLSAKEAAAAKNASSGPLALAGGALEEIRKLTGVSRPGLAKLLAAAQTYAETSAIAAAGADGKLSLTDAKKLAVGLEPGYLSLRGRATPPAPPATITDLGVISDIDKTVLPPSPSSGFLAPYPGVSVLFKELDLAADGELDATHYVTARAPSGVVDIPAWLDEHALPSGSIDTGIGTAPWVAEKEKVKDVLAVMDAHPGQKYVLFGDTSHRDPEVYKKVAAERPEQVAMVVIHKVNATVKPVRSDGMQLVNNYAEAAAALYKAELIDKLSAQKVIASARAQGLELTAAQGDALLA
jgi:hypothetical protein